MIYQTYTLLISRYCFWNSLAVIFLGVENNCFELENPSFKVETSLASNVKYPQSQGSDMLGGRGAKGSGGNSGSEGRDHPQHNLTAVNMGKKQPHMRYTVFLAKIQYSPWL